MKRLLGMALAVLPLAASASSPVRISLDEMARSADHIAIGRVQKVDMVDQAGRINNDPAAMTGPCVGNTIRLHVRIDKVLATSAKAFPAQVLVPLDSFMHFSLGQIQAAHRDPGAASLYLLKGPAFAPVAPGAFRLDLAARKKVMRIHARSPRQKHVDDDGQAQREHCRQMDEHLLKLQGELQGKEK
jgi:hypothetical protein